MDTKKGQKHTWEEEQPLKFSTYGEMLQRGTQILLDAQIEEAETDSFLLFSYVTGMPRAKYFLRREKKPTALEVQKYDSCLEQRKSHVPLQYITGEQEFMGLSFSVDERVLIPRQDTEKLVETVLPYVSGKRVLDLCTGSGCIAVSLAVLGKPEYCVGVDISSGALQLAEKNAKENGARVSFVESDLFSKVSDTFDIIVSNPPYIASDTVKTLMPEVREHEPILALDGGVDGLAFYRRMIGESRSYLSEGGMLFLEIGYDQAEEVEHLMREAKYEQIRCKQDYAGLDRVVYGQAVGGNYV